MRSTMIVDSRQNRDAKILTGRRGNTETITTFLIGCEPYWEDLMLYWALIFLLVAIVAGALGFGGIAGASAGIAKILFFVFLVLLIVSLIAHISRGRAP